MSSLDSLFLANLRVTTRIAKNEIIQDVISINQKQAEFWKNPHGWASTNAAELLSISRLDWQESLSETLYIWKVHATSELTDGELILAWANLGALVEGTMKLFLSVHYEDYGNDESRYLNKKKNKLQKPDILTFESLKQFLSKKDITELRQLY